MFRRAQKTEANGLGKGHTGSWRAGVSVEFTPYGTGGMINSMPTSTTPGSGPMTAWLAS